MIESVLPRPKGTDNARDSSILSQKASIETFAMTKNTEKEGSETVSHPFPALSCALIGCACFILTLSLPLAVSFPESSFFIVENSSLYDFDAFHEWK